MLAAIHETGTPCIAGLDPALDRVHEAFLREHGVLRTEIDELDADAGAELLFQFSATVIDAVRGLVPAVKPQSAYFERYGAAGIRALERTIAHARAAGLLIVLDVKRGDTAPSEDRTKACAPASMPMRGAQS